MLTRKNDYIKELSITAMCIALCCVLPIPLPFELRNKLSPMHIPVLLCGLVCGWPYGLLCGLMGPVVSNLTTGMPPVAMLPRMMPELAMYGFACGLLMKIIRTGKTAPDLVICLVLSMILGRIAGGVATVIVGGFPANKAVLSAFFVSYVAQGAVGIVVHLVLIPTLVLALQKAKLLPPRYKKVKA